MNEWSKLQKDFQNYLCSSHSDMEESIVDTKQASSQIRLQVYRNAYQARLEEALASNFPYLKVCLGNEAFHQLSLDYSASHPSTHRSIRWYGDTLADFLIQYYDEEFHFLAELAQFEWHMTMAFDAADAPLFELAQMAAVSPEKWGDMVLKAHPSIQRMDLLWNVVSLWEALANEKEPPSMSKDTKASPWVLWRHAYLNRFYSLSDDEAWAMDKMLTGQPFCDLCEGLCQWHDEEDVGLRAASLLKSWIQSGLIADILF
ncbi:DNA-binding domain-containing protein [Fluoribacter gormanii]|uniref:HvfC/BufC N-terminal domain-containing protein n=1 Tax=Fluoribacter gormanii TaxID=464 RepID=UPI002244C757|nr:DNA-binding domain-containing protein [Fluoribacter gormanii]MCW8443137.1 DNA-binding domain-containing protein [Fluoribacter gormanii]